MARRNESPSARVARVAGAVVIVAGGVLTYNLLVPESDRLGPVIWQGAGRVVGPLVLVLGIPGLVAGRGARARRTAGIACVVASFATGLGAWMLLGAQPFVRTVFVAAAAVLAMLGVALLVAGREEPGAS